jgi:hypothetical protein
MGMDTPKNITFAGYPSLNELVTERAKEEWGCTNAEAINTAMLMLATADPDTQTSNVAAFRAASTRARRTGNSIVEEFKHALLKLQQPTGGTGRGGRVAQAIEQTHGKDEHRSQSKTG